MPVDGTKRRSLGDLLVGCLLGGAIAGAGAGAIDALWSWGDASQFVQTFGGKLRLLVFLATAYAVAAALNAVLDGLTFQLWWRYTRIGELVLPRFADAERAQARGGSDAVSWTALAIAGMPTVLVSLMVNHSGCINALQHRKHLGLKVAVIILSTVAALVAALFITFAIARVVELGLRQVWKPQPKPAKTVDADSLNGLGFAVAALPLVAIALAVCFQISAGHVEGAKKIDQVVTFTMAVASGAFVAPLVLAFFVRTWLGRSLGRLAGDGTLSTYLRSRWAPIAAIGVLAAVGAIAVLVVAWSTLKLLNLRPFSTAALTLVLFVPAARAGLRLAPRIPRGGALGGVAVFVTFFVMVFAGDSAGVRKAATNYSGLGAPLMKTFRVLGDFDRDGYSRILGGGDCDDWDSSVNPGADDIPDDGIDQNCVNGDLKTQCEGATTDFASLPPTIPKDLNVVLITIDTVRADHFSSYGYKRKTTPRMDEVAAEGTVFKNGWAHAPSTRYSVPAILTGRYPLSVEYFSRPGQWPGITKGNTTLAEVAKQRGLYTGAVLNYRYFTPWRLMNQGFDFYDNKNARYHRGVPGKGPAETTGSSSKQQTATAIKFLDQHANKRFFLWVHYYDPHYRFEKNPEVTDFGDSDIDRYDNEILYTDKYIGKLFDALRAKGVYGKTAIIITGDHGEGFGEHGVSFHGYHLYSPQTRVPFIVRVPGTKPAVVQTPASHVDIMPTLANLLGADTRWDMQGQSLVSSITGAAPPDKDRWVFQQLSYENNNEMRAAANKDCHIIYNVSPHLSWELYNITKDPGETKDIIDNPGECSGARAVLEKWYDTSQIPLGACAALLRKPPTIAKPLDVSIGNKVQLVDIKVPATVKRGKNFDITYTFLAKGNLQGKWRIFAHFQNARRRMLFQGDHVPARPFAWWQDGQYIRYTKTVSVPRNAQLGDVTMWLGIYKGATRLPIRTSQVPVDQNRAGVAKLKVVR